MNRDSFVTLLLAVCCIGAAGVSATTLGSTLSQGPDDVIDVDYSKLPIGEDQGETVKGLVQKDTGSSSSGAPDESSAESSTESSQSSETNAEGVPSGSTENGGSQSGGSDSPGQSEGTRPSEGSGTGLGQLSLLERLLLLLERLLPLLALLVALALAYRYRRRLLAFGLALASVLRGRDDEEAATATRWPSEQPTNEVHRAWLSMVSRLDIDRPRTRTPSQCAAAAMETGLDPTAIRTLTTVFEEVRYGDEPVTDDRRRRARKGLERLDGGETR